MSAGIALNVGSIVSSIIKEAYFTSVFPQASVAVNSQTCSSAPPQSEMVLNKILVTVGVQASVAEAVIFQASNAVVLPIPSHSTVMFTGAVNTGSIRSAKIVAL